MKRLNKQPKPAIPESLIATNAGALYRTCPTCGSSDLSVAWLSCHPYGHRWRQKCCAGCGDLGWEHDILTRIVAGTECAA